MAYFVRRKVNSLGHMVSKEGLRLDESKVEVIKDWQAPKDIHQLRRFLGFAFYHSKFVQNSSLIACPLHNPIKTQCWPTLISLNRLLPRQMPARLL